LCAFLDAYVDLLDAHVELVLDSENAATGSRYRVGAYRFWHRHVAVLLEETHEDADYDADYLAHALLAPLAADLYQALRSESYDVDRIKSGLRALATAVTS
jgi:hypothetical protein